MAIFPSYLEGYQAGEAQRLRNAKSKALIGAGMTAAGGDYETAKKALLGGGYVDEAKAFDELGQSDIKTKGRAAAAPKLADGDYTGGAQAAFGAGDFETGKDLSTFSNTMSAQDRATHAANFGKLASIAGSVKTMPPQARPAAMLQMLQGSPYDTPQVRQAIQQAAADGTISDEEINSFQTQMMTAAEQLAQETKGLPSGYAWKDPAKGAAGGMYGVEGGPGDPKIIEQNAEARHITVNVGGADVLDDDGMDLAAAQYSAYGTLPSLGMGPGAAATKQHIINLAAKQNKELGITPTAAMVSRGDFSANLGSLKKLRQTADAVQAYEETTQRNLALAEKLLGDAGLSNVPLANVWMNRMNQSVTSNPKLSAYVAALESSLDEYTKVVAGTTGGSAPASDAARKSIEERLSKASTPAQVRAVLTVIRQEMKNRTGSLNDQMDQIRGRMSSDVGSPKRIKLD